MFGIQSYELNCSRYSKAESKSHVLGRSFPFRVDPSTISGFQTSNDISPILSPSNANIHSKAFAASQSATSFPLIHICPLCPSIICVHVGFTDQIVQKTVSYQTRPCDSREVSQMYLPSH